MTATVPDYIIFVLQTLRILSEFDEVLKSLTNTFLIELGVEMLKQYGRLIINRKEVVITPISS